MIVNTALADMVERDVDGGEITRLAGALPARQSSSNNAGLRKFRRAAGAAVNRVDDAAELARGIVEFGKPDRGAAGGVRGGGEPLHQCGAVLLDLLRLVAEQPRDLAQHVDKGRFAVARGVGKISAAPDRLAVGVRNMVSGQPPCSPR